jgi:hypothetical protein
MKFSSLILIILGLFLFSCQSPEKPKTPEQLRFELELNEKRSPKRYLQLEKVTVTTQKKKTRKAGLFRNAEYKHDGELVKGIVKNTASVAKFKDVRIEFKYYSKTKTVIKKSTYVIYNYYEPHSQKAFSFKIDDYPSAAKSYSAVVIGAQGM